MTTRALIRFMLAAVLAAAAFAKFLAGGWSSAIGVVELVLAGGILAVPDSGLVRIGGLAAFAGFCGYGLHRAITGAAAPCGCFGEFELQPWEHAALSTSLFVMWLAASLRPTESRRRINVLIPAASFAFAISGALIGGYAEARQATRRDGPVDGQPWRFLAATAAELDSGRWEIAVVRPNCPACKAWLAASSNKSADAGVMTALLVLATPDEFEAQGVMGRFDKVIYVPAEARPGRLGTPCRLRVEDGIVTILQGCQT